MAKLIGTAPNQVPTNGDLGSMAFEDKQNYVTRYNPIYQPYRNLIINGDMSIAQRGTSTSGLGFGNAGYYTCDRWRSQTDLGTWTISQSTDVPTGQGFANSFKMDCTSAGTANSDEVGIRQYIEGQFLQQLAYGTSSAKSITISFWIKSNKTGDYTFSIKNVNSSQERLLGFNYTIESANTWEKKTFTFSGDTSTSIENTNSAEFELYWWFSTASALRSGTVSNTWENFSSSNYAISTLAGLGGSTADEVYLTGVQLEVGTSASDFEFLPHDINFQRCARYFQQTRESSDRLAFGGRANGDTAIDFGFPLVVPLRSTPTASQSGTEWRAWRPTANLAQSSATFTVQAWVENNPWVALRVSSFPSSSFTNNYFVGIGPSNLYINLDAEL